MKYLIVILTAASMLLVACQGNSSKEGEGQKTEINQEEVVDVTFEVNGMTCTGCEDAISKNVGELNGVVSCESNHEEGWTKVSYDASQLSEEEVIAAIEDKGYEVKGKM